MYALLAPEGKVTDVVEIPAFRTDGVEVGTNPMDAKTS